MTLILCATCVTSHASWHTFYSDTDGTMKIGVLLLCNIVVLNMGIVTRQHSLTEYIGKLGTGRLDMRCGGWKTRHEVWGLEDWT